MAPILRKTENKKRYFVEDCKSGESLGGEGAGHRGDGAETEGEGRNAQRKRNAARSERTQRSTEGASDRIAHDHNPQHRPDPAKWQQS